MNKLYFCVVEDWKGNVTVSSFGGKSKAEERRNAKSCSRYCFHVGESYDEAEKIAAAHRRDNELEKNI